nr:uncharacterized mitochondrial protein AtMg00810-like [Tanacetum cinerariifolium]
MHKAFLLPGESSHWQYKFSLLVEGVPTARRMEIPLLGVCTAMMKKLPVKDRWQVGWDWSYMANDEEDHALVADEVAPTEFALMANTSAESKKIETLKQEKEGVDGKLTGLLTASKNLDNLIKIQRSDKNKDGLGYSVVPPPPPQLYSSPKKDLSWTGLLEFANDTVTDYSRPSPTVESTSGDDQIKNPSASENVASPITPNPFIKFVKPKDTQSKSKTDETETPKKPLVKKRVKKSFTPKPVALRPYRPPGSSQNNIDDKGYWDSGCSRHITGNISYLFDYEPFDGGYVSFGQGGCKITCKETIKTECIVLGRDFKLLDDANILLRTPRQHNMYSIDLNNIAPHKDLTCLVAKASTDECMLWHRRLGTKDATSKEVKKNVSSLIYIALPNWAHDALLESSSSRPQDHCSTEVPKGSGNPNPIASTSNPAADPMEILTVESPIPTATRLVAQRHTQDEGIDYNEVFAHVARIEAIRLFFAYASFMGFTVYQIDVKSAFLYGTIDEEVEFEALMHEKFQMSAIGELNLFLGLLVLQKEDGIFLSQDKFVGDILKKLRYSDVRSSNTPMDKENPWRKDETRKDVDLHLYRSMIGSLMYLTAFRPDIMFAVCTWARHQVTPKECHLHAVKRIFRYLKGHPKLGLWYPKESPFDLVAYSDSDYGGATQDLKSTTRGDCFEKKLIDVNHIHTDENVADLLTKPFDAGRFQYLVCKLFPLLGKLSTVSVFLGFELTFAGTTKYWGVLRILMISFRLIPL